MMTPWLSFWLPVIAPVMSAFVTPLIECLLNMRDSSTYRQVRFEQKLTEEEVEAHFRRDIANDVRNMSTDAFRAVTASCLAVDAWAFSLIPGTANAADKSQMMWLVIPAHFVLVFGAATFTASYSAGPPRLRRIVGGGVVAAIAVSLAIWVRLFVA